MTRVMRAELLKLTRRRVVAITTALTVVASVAAAALVLISAEPGPAGGARPGRGPTVGSLAAAGGATGIFTDAIAFAGVLVFVVVVGITAADFSHGSIRTTLLRQPSRARVLAGRTAAMLTFCAVVLAAAEVLVWSAASAIAPSQGVDTAAWRSVEALGHGLVDYGAALYWVSAYTLLGTAVGALIRSVPIALGVGIAWSGPFEHILADAWSPAREILPGLSLETFIVGGFDGVSAGQALATSAAYAAVAGLAAAVVFTRRDVT